MKIKQVSDILNNVFHEVIGESGNVTEDLSNIVDVGRAITSTTQWGNNFENYVGKIIDKVGRTIFKDDVYKGNTFNIWRDSWEYASVLEKVRCEVGDYKENPVWDLSNYTPAVFSFERPDVVAKYFNSKTTFEIKLSIARKQAESAFNSAGDMNRFFSMIENRVKTKMEVAKEELARRTIVNLIAEKIKSNNNVVNLLSEYKTETGSTINASKAMNDKDFLKFASKKIGMYKKFITELSMLYNDDGYPTFTPAERRNLLLITDFSQSLNNNLYGDTYNEEYVKLDGFSEISYWQGRGTNNSYTDRSSIDVLPASFGGDAGVENANVVKKSGIVAVLFDKNACMCCNETPYIDSIYNPEGRFYNYWYRFDCSYFNDTAENCIVFTIED